MFPSQPDVPQAAHAALRGLLRLTTRSSAARLVASLGQTPSAY